MVKNTCKIVFVIARLALAFEKEAGLIGAAFFFAALVFVATAEPRIDAAIANIRTVGVDADAVDVTIVKF